MPDTNDNFAELNDNFAELTARVAANLRADLDRRWMEAITLGPVTSDFENQSYTRTVSASVTPSKALDIATLMQTIDDFEERYHRKDVKLFEAMLDCGVMVVADPNLEVGQMVLRVPKSADRAVREATNIHFDKAIRK